MTAGYSGTPLAKKLGIKEGSRVAVLHAPPGYALDGVKFDDKAEADDDVVQLFVMRRATLEGELARLRKLLRPDAALWISWPKKASKVPTDVTEDRIRELALPLGFVDVKVCAVSDVWSGLKLVVRKELR
jgi:hypothetical protein